jgi:Mn-dependent DtxR family transcriptional regulator
LHSAGNGERGKEKKKMEEKVLAAMKEAGKPVRPGDVAKLLGVESKDVSKAISELKKKGKVISPKRCFYSVGE